MKLALLATLFSALSVAGASGQNAGQIVVNVGSGTNCIQGSSLSGFNALSWTIGGVDPVSVGSGGGAGAGKPALNDLTLTRNVDVCSETLIRYFLVGERYPTLTLTQYESRGGSGQTYAYMVVTLSNAVINGYSVGGSNSVDPGETVSFGYSKVCVQTTGQNPDGSLKTPVSVCYNLATNQIQ
jgi:type VI secretion system secreted protein Hcp